MPAAQVAQADGRVEFVEHPRVACARAQVVAGREQVAGVQAHPGAIGIGDALDQRGKLFEGAADVRPLPRRALHHGRHAFGLLQRLVDVPGDLLDAALAGHLHALLGGAGVEVQVAEPEHLAAAHLVQERDAGLGDHLRIGTAQVDQVAVMRQDVAGREPVLPAGAAEGGGVLVRQRALVPDPLVAGEHADGGGAELHRIAHGVLDAPGDRHVRADAFHPAVLIGRPVAEVSCPALPCPRHRWMSRTVSGASRRRC